MRAVLLLRQEPPGAPLVSLEHVVLASIVVPIWAALAVLMLRATACALSRVRYVVARFAGVFDRLYRLEDQVNDLSAALDDRRRRRR